MTITIISILTVRRNNNNFVRHLLTTLLLLLSSMTFYIYPLTPCDQLPQPLPDDIIIFLQHFYRFLRLFPSVSMNSIQSEYLSMIAVGKDKIQFKNEKNWQTQEIYRAAGKMIIIKVVSTHISFRNYKVRKRSR